MIGLRYFNVYGPNEQHKGRMASVAFHQYFQYRRTGKVKLFEGCLGYGNGEQSRDFVYVGDVCKVLMHFLDKPVSGVYNCGTGRAQPFNDVSPKPSRASTRPSRRPTSRTCARPAATSSSARFRRAPASTCRTSSPPSRTWKNDEKGRISRP